MSSDTSQLLPPGSSTYDSDTVGLHVGDGTWDAGKDTFLLPNLMGLPFDAMRYNGMGNRFADIAEYHQLVLVHAVFASITFLAVVPLAIFIARFYHRNPRLALRLHIWLQITTVFLATVVLILGWFAVGPARSLSNPHHGIGVAIYTLIMAQVLGGWFIHRVEKGKMRNYIPLKLFLHQWLGRAIALLAIAQVALGMTLYGSPKSLFILYTLWIFLLVFLYFILEYRHQKAYALDDRASYMYSATDVTGASGRRPSGDHSRLGKLAAAGGIGAALGFLGRRRSQRRAESQERRTEVSDATTRRSSRPPSGSYLSDEKYTEVNTPRKHTLRDRLLAAGAGIGVLAAARNLFGGKKHQDDAYSDITGSSYDHRPRRGSQSDVETTTDIRRVEEGRPPASPPDSRVHDPAVLSVAMASPSRRSKVRSRRSGDSMTSYDSRYSYGTPVRSRRNSHLVRNTVATLGLAGFLKHKWNSRKAAKEDQRIAEMRERDREAERIARQNSSRRKFTGDGAPPARVGRRQSFTESEMSPVTGSTPALSRHTLSRPSPIAAHNIPPPGHSSSTLPPPPPIPTAGLRHDSSYNTDSVSSVGTPRTGYGPTHSSHRLGEAVAAGAGAAAVAGAAGRSSRYSSHDEVTTGMRRESIGGQPGGSEPVSVKVKMHEDGRHVTLRRLDAQEAAAERARRRTGRKNPRSSSVSSVGGSSNDRWRRNENRERMEAEEMRRAGTAAAADTYAYNPPLPGIGEPPPPPPPLSSGAPQATAMPGLPGAANPATGYPPPASHSTSPYHPTGPGGPPPIHDLSSLPPPPPIPASYSALNVGSPASQLYESSAAGSRADSNRRRRRAERARAEQAAREARGNRGTVEFT